MRLLIVDDSIMLQNRLKSALMLINSDIYIKQSTCCTEAMDIFSSFEPETVILDIELPDGSGIDLLQKFKKEKPAVKVHIFTNHASYEFRKRCMDLSASSFIDKSNLQDLLNNFK